MQPLDERFAGRGKEHDSERVGELAGRHDGAARGVADGAGTSGGAVAGIASVSAPR
jgi:hypothetical protein